jgi:cation transporter-like permease
MVDGTEPRNNLFEKLIAEEILDRQSRRKMRERFAYSLLALTVILVVLSVFGGPVASFMIGGGSITTIGMFYIILRWLFPKNR